MTSPTREIGQLVVLPTWGILAGTDPADPPAFQFPQRVTTVERMRTDPQIDALCSSLTMPIMRYRWELDPNGARDEVVQQTATDFGIPIAGSNDPAPRSRRRFKHRDHLEHALLALWHGFMMFEQVPDTERFDLVRDGWRLRKLAPRLPGTIDKLHVAPDGGLAGISQHGYRPPPMRGRRAGAWSANEPDPQIGVNALLAYVWKREGANWYGRSMLRPLYRDWILKDRALRVDAIKNERFGVGIPTATAPEGGDPAQYSKLAQNMRVSEMSGVGLPAGASVGVEGIRGTLPDVMASIRYYDESMARAFMAMIIQLGQTQTGSRALGNTFADHFQMLVEAVADWYKDTTNEHAIEDYVDWNWGEDEQAPLLRWSYAEHSPLAVADLVAMATAGVITMDRETEDAVRKQTQLPSLQPAEEGSIDDAASSAFTQVGLPALVDSFILTPEEARTLIGVSGPAPQAPVVENLIAAMRPQAARADIQRHVAAALGSRLPFAHVGSRAVRAALVGRREPNAVELAAKTDFAVLQERWEDATSSLVDDWKGVQSIQIDALVDQVAQAVVAGDISALANLTAPVQGQELLRLAMLEMAEDAVVGAKAEAAAQGVAIPNINLDDAVAPSVSKRAQATAQLLAHGLADAAERKALNIAGGEALGPDEVAAAVREHLEGLSDAFLNDMLGGALTQAQNAGRRAVMVEKPAEIYSSELLDANTCSACASVDGKEYDDLLDADSDYPAGGFKDCLGGPRCRGTLVAVYAEGDGSTPTKPEPDTPLREGADALDGALEDTARGTYDARSEDVVEWYTGSGAQRANRLLRGDEDIPARTQTFIDDLDATIAQSVLSEDTQVYRAVHSADDVLGAELAPGSLVEDKGYMSTTTSSSFAGNHLGAEGGAIMRVRVPAGRSGLAVDHFEVGGESEVLLPRGTTLRVVTDQQLAWENRGVIRVIDVEVVDG